MRDSKIARWGWEYSTPCTLLSIIGKGFQDAGLRDLCVESRAIVEGSVAGVLIGRRYNRGDSITSCMKPSWDWHRKAWIEENQRKSKTTIDSFFSEIGKLCHDICKTQFKRHMTSVDFVKFFGKYVEFLRYENGKLSKFWLAYLDMVEIPLRLLRASWEGSWELYVTAIRSMIQWCFA